MYNGACPLQSGGRLAMDPNVIKIDKTPLVDEFMDMTSIMGHGLKCAGLVSTMISIKIV